MYKVIIVLLICVCGIGQSFAQTYKDSIQLQNEEHTMIHLGDRIQLTGAEQEYIVTNIDHSICLCKPSRANRTIWTIYGVSCNKTLTIYDLAKKLAKVEGSDFLTRRNQNAEFTLRRFRSKDGEKIGVVSFVSMFADSLQMSHLDENGIYVSSIIDSKQLIPGPAPEPKSLLDTTLYLAAALHWISDKQLISTDGATMGQFDLGINESFVVSPHAKQNDQTQDLYKLGSALRKNDSKKGLSQDYRMQNSYLWQYQNGLLKLWSTGVFEFDQEEERHIEYSNAEIVLKPMAVSSSSIRFEVVDKKHQVFRKIKSNENYSSSSPAYRVDSIKVNHPIYSHLAFGDLIKLKEDTARYFVKELRGWDLYLVDERTRNEKRIRQSQERYVHVELDSILEKNHRNMSGINREFPVHTKVLNSSGGESFIREMLFEKEVAVIGKRELSAGSTLEEISFDKLVSKDQNFETRSDTIEFIHATQFWNLDKLIFNMHSEETGKIALGIGDRISFNHPLHFEKDQSQKIVQEISMDHASHQYNFMSTDFFVHSKGRADFDGVWSLEKDIVNLWVLGYSLSAKNQKLVQSYKRGKRKNYWMHRIQLKIVKLSTTQIIFELVEQESELGKPLLNANFSHL